MLFSFSLPTSCCCLTRNFTANGRQDEAAILHDRTYIEEMKADILRRAEAISDEDTDEVDHPDGEEELEPGALSPLKVVGDGEESSEEEVDNEEDGKARQNPETILELAYLRDPKLFDRDAHTRRGKFRADLKAQTGVS